MTPPINSDLTTRSIRIRVHVNDDERGIRRYLPGGVEIVLDDGTTINVSEATAQGSFSVHGSDTEAVKTGIQFYGAIEYVEHPATDAYGIPIQPTVTRRSQMPV